MKAYSSIRAYICACIANSVSYSVSVLVNRYRRSLRPPSSFPSPRLPLVVSLPTNARISNPHFSRVLPRYRADSLSLSFFSLSLSLSLSLSFRRNAAGNHRRVIGAAARMDNGFNGLLRSSTFRSPRRRWRTTFLRVAFFRTHVNARLTNRSSASAEANDREYTHTHIHTHTHTHTHTHVKFD